METKERSNEVKDDKNLYSGWLTSNSLIKRSLAITGHNLIGTIIIYGLISIILIFIGVIIESIL